MFTCALMFCLFHPHIFEVKKCGKKKIVFQNGSLPKLCTKVDKLDLFV